ncbi:MAG TPA: Rrf2 family transcriptional regulator [Mesorhizobium sp.]|jgi:Rrf2 family protein|nr:Rrf2 family transcriptional regulator [Mesorhizobium sp.]
MKRNSKFSLALHALGHMAVRPDRPMTSELIADHNATNPVVVRRVLGLLREAGLLTSEKGHAGGWSLARPAAEIKLSDVYKAVGEPFLMRNAGGEDNPPHCAIERALHHTVDIALADAEALLVERLASRSVEELAAALSRPGAQTRGEGPG